MTLDAMRSPTVDLEEKEKDGAVRIEEQQVEYAQQSRDEDEKRLVRRLDKRIMPMICAMYLFACESHFLRAVMVH